MFRVRHRHRRRSSDDWEARRMAWIATFAALVAAVAAAVSAATDLAPFFG